MIGAKGVSFLPIELAAQAKQMDAELCKITVIRG